jgi:hypothetical protein
MIDHLIIQKGKASQTRASAVEMTNIIQYGAQNVIFIK